MTQSASQRAAQMKRLPQEVRERSITESDNVVGYDRFMAVRHQVELAHAMKSPKKPEGAA